MCLWVFLEILGCLDGLGDWALGPSEPKFLLSSAVVPVVHEAGVLYTLGDGVGRMTCEKQVVARLDGPCC